jgi:predicted Fe-Mo cluster-binding NifX family protein
MCTCTNYINYICNDWSKLKYLPKLELEEIEKLTDDIIKMYLFCYYMYFDQLDKYDLLNLKMPINKNNDNLYLMASFGGHVEVMEYLENKGVDTTIKNNHGNNAYLMASQGGQIKVMKYLEMKGFDINVENNYGSNAYSLAYKKGHSKVIEYLENKKYKKNITEIHNDCIVCMSNNNDKYISCKFMHDIHVECQKKSGKSHCLICFYEY